MRKVKTLRKEGGDIEEGEEDKRKVETSEKKTVVPS